MFEATADFSSDSLYVLGKTKKDVWGRTKKDVWIDKTSFSGRKKLHTRSG